MPILPTASTLKRHLTDPGRLCELLGLPFRREGGGVKVCCPWHAEQNPDCSVKLGPDGTIAVHCFACGANGDALSLIAAVRGLDIKADFQKVLAAAASLIGERELEVAPPTPRPTVQRPRPPAGQVQQLWTSCRSVSAEAAALAARGLEATELEQLQLARLLPAGTLPRWAVFKGESWAARHRFIVPMWGSTGVMESLHARALAGPDPKALSPAGHSLHGLVFADAAGQELLRTGIALAKREGCCSLVLANLFAFCAAGAVTLTEQDDPVGPEGDAWLVRLARKAAVVVAAWGDGGGYRDRAMGAELVLCDAKVRLMCLGTLETGHPAALREFEELPALRPFGIGAAR